MKRLSLSLDDFFNLPTAEIFNPDNFSPVKKVFIDSRNVVKNSLFIAIEGEKLDGHKFVSEAIKKGASVVMINKKNVKEFPEVEIPFVTVEDTTKALGDLARIWRSKLKAKVIGISGSNGKTSTKEMLALLLSQKYSVNKTIANNNNHIGVPLTILSTNEKHDLLVAEMGTNHFGETRYSASIAQPDYALITNIGDSHLEFLKDRSGVLKEKSSLFEETANYGGTIVVNNDDKLLKDYSKKFDKKISYSLKNSRADVKGTITGYTEDGRPIVKVEFKKMEMNFELPVFGENSAKNFMSAVSIGFEFDLTKNQIISGLKKLKPVDKRLNIKIYKSFYLIDDTYNANPESMKAAFSLLGKIKIYKTKTAVLGDMFELGRLSAQLHKSLADEIMKNKISNVFTIGSAMKNLHIGLKNKNIETKHFSNREDLKAFLNRKDFSGSVVLVKGSRGMKMEEFIQVIEDRAGA